LRGPLRSLVARRAVRRLDKPKRTGMRSVWPLARRTERMRTGENAAESSHPHAIGGRTRPVYWWWCSPGAPGGEVKNTQRDRTGNIGMTEHCCEISGVRDSTATIM